MCPETFPREISLATSSYRKSPCSICPRVTYLVTLITMLHKTSHDFIYYFPTIVISPWCQSSTYNFMTCRKSKAPKRLFFHHHAYYTALNFKVILLQAFNFYYVLLHVVFSLTQLLSTKNRVALQVDNLMPGRFM